MAAITQQELGDQFLNIFWESSSTDEDDEAKAEHLTEAINTLKTCGIWRSEAKHAKQFNRMLHNYVEMSGSYLLGNRTMLAIPEEWYPYITNDKFVRAVKRLRAEGEGTDLEVEQQLPIVEIRARPKMMKTLSDNPSSDIYRHRMMYQDVCDQVAELIYNNGRMTNSGILGEAQQIDKSREELFASKFVVVIPAYQRSKQPKTKTTKVTRKVGRYSYTFNKKELVEKRTKVRKLQKMRTKALREGQQLKVTTAAGSKLGNMVRHAKRHGIQMTIKEEMY